MILAWEIPWTEEPGSCSPRGFKRVGQDLATKQQKTSLLCKLDVCFLPVPWRFHIYLLLSNLKEKAKKPFNKVI